MRTKTQSIFFALAAGAAASFSVIAAAGPAAAHATVDPTTAAPKPVKAPVAEKKICMTMEPMTGSRLTRKVCQTRAEWEAEGFTVSTRAEAKSAERR